MSYRMPIYIADSSTLWTTEKPTVDGIYWYRPKSGQPACIVEVSTPYCRTENQPMDLRYIGNECDWPMDYTVDGDWCGPIEPPL